MDVWHASKDTQTIVRVFCGNISLKCELIEALDRLAADANAKRCLYLVMVTRFWWI